ncbi:MAG: hypothetical protein GY755_08850 [Chloroflexi bacterium]|nr:hypothetical protein [Chloroflexota bacterium]
MKNNKTLSLPVSILYVFFALFIGFILGAAVAFISDFFYFAFLFPILIGATAAWILGDVIKTRKIRSKPLIIFLSILMGLIIYGTYHVVSYTNFRTQAKSSFVARAEEEGTLTNQEIFDLSKEIVDFSLIQETGESGFLGYILFKAKVGVSIGKVFRSSKLNLGSFFTWIYWLIEFLLITGIVLASTTKDTNSELFCETCQDWITLKEHLGGIDEESKFQDLQDFIQQKKFNEAGQLLKQAVGVPSIEVYAKSCGCDTVDIKLSQTSFDINNDVAWRDILNTTISLAQLNEFKQNISA